MPLRNPFKRNTLEHSDSSAFTSTPTTGTSTPDHPHPTIEVQLHDIDSNGAFLPPNDSPIRPTRWPSTSNSSTRSATHSLDDTEPFRISRESFDSYRRSFDIGAREPVQSSANTPARTPVFERRSDKWEEEKSHFEEVVLDEPALVRKRGLFARLSDGPGEKNGAFTLFAGRKRSEQGAEMARLRPVGIGEGRAD
ncbi:hypothetical protein BT63DRAFT_480814 [Microthyrium microscopicum]|uniref:Uncharacterized protein n=1 Tax=Microthyrium microscopicum TaxID=703497 RepID=A0A6A6U6W5_9PEZI|nr:hypothetical protein BT63DRAFT_480814 [Microthyrium microscopicum]